MISCLPRSSCLFDLVEERDGRFQFDVIQNVLVRVLVVVI